MKTPKRTKKTIIKAAIIALVCIALSFAALQINRNTERNQTVAQMKFRLNTQPLNVE